MCNAFKYTVYLAVCFSYIFGLPADEWHLQFINCTQLNECPDNSICTKVGATLKCVCWQGHIQHPDWNADDIENNEVEYCARGAANKTKLYNRLPAKRENLAVAILLILFGVIVVTLILYCMVVLRPINRTKAAYRRIRLRRNNHRRLEEFDDIDMSFPDLRSVENLS
ncbi:hypothetical protein ACLKA6_000485 [Drosophila palustris]